MIARHNRSSKEPFAQFILFLSLRVNANSSHVDLRSVFKPSTPRITVVRVEDSGVLGTVRLYLFILKRISYKGRCTFDAIR